MVVPCTEDGGAPLGSLAPALAILGWQRGVFVSTRVAPSDSLSFHTWIPGRLLHVRCHTPRATLDIIAGYQHVCEGSGHPQAAANRGHYWDQLSKLLQGLPNRNMVVLGMDANTHLAARERAHRTKNPENGTASRS